jgi:hypothetical protein
VLQPPDFSFQLRQLLLTEINFAIGQRNMLL